MFSIKFISLKMLICFGILIFTTNISFGQNKFIGADKCGMCHKSDKQGKQLSIWQNSQHAKAFQTLQTKEADKIAASKGIKTKAAEAKECLSCHTSQGPAAAGSKFKIEDGVQCETCHGAGSEYQSLKVMKDHNLAVKNGLIENKNMEKFCTGCHNSKSPTFKGFKLNEYWAKIKHDVPKS